jgi:membrane protein YqaA with SNARE-associated domain
VFSFIVTVLINYILVLGSIILFILPFYLLYKRTLSKDDAKHHSWNKKLETFFLSKQANYLVFFWAMGEALIWFVIPEFLLLLVVFMRIRRKKELLFYDIAGTAAGTLLAFMLHVPQSVISNLPYIQDKMVDQTVAWYDKMGTWGLFYQPFSGVPYKVFTLAADNYEFFIPAFLLLAILVRMSRYVIFFGLFVALYPGLHKFVYKNYVRLFLIATLIFSLLLLKVYRNYGQDYIIKSTIYNHAGQRLT